MHLLYSLLLSTLISTLPGNNATLRAKHFNLENGVALKGYDPVAYFTQGKAVKGSKTYSCNYDGIVYYFANTEDKNKFLQNPAGYEPAYGGWCAYAMGAKGEKVDIDPETFKIVNGRLYVFYNRFFNNTLTSWNKDEKHLLPQADANWARIFK